MSSISRIAKNTAVMIIGEITGKVLSLIFVIYVARYLQAEGFGTLSFALAFAGMFHIFSDIGFYELTVREVARDKRLAGKFVGNVMIIKAILVAIVFGLMCLTINAMGYPHRTVIIVYIVGLSIVFDAFSVISNAIFQAFERLEFITIGTVLRGLLLVVGGIVAVKYSWGILAFALLYLLASLVVLVYSLSLMIAKFAKPKFEVDLDFWKFLLREGVPFWASAVLTTIFYNIDKVMLSAMVGNEAVGYYSAAYRLVTSLNIIPLAVIASIYPVTSRLYISSRNSLMFAFERSLKYMIILGIFIIVIVSLLSKRIILFIYGENYYKSIIVFQILIWSEVFLFVNSNIRNLLKSINKQIIIMYVCVYGVLLNVAMNALLIPKYSYVGASMATVLTEVNVLIIYSYWIVKNGYGLSNSTLFSILKGTILAMLLSIVCIFLKEVYGVNISVTIFALIFIILLYILKIIDDIDIKLIKETLNFIKL